MASTLNKTLPGFGPIEKTRFTFTDTLLANLAATLTVSELLHGLLSMTPTVTRILTLPAAAVLEASSITLAGLQVADAIPFILRNQAAPGSGFNVVLAVGAGGAVDSEANLTVPPNTHSEYMLRIDDANPTSPNYTVFQIDSGSAGGGPSASAYFSAAAVTFPGTTTIAAAPTLYNSTWTVAAGVAPAQGVTLAGTGLTTTFTVTDAGIYKIDASMSADITVVNDARIGFFVAVGGAVVVQALMEIGNETIATPNVHGSNGGSIILDLAAGAVLTLFLDGNNTAVITSTQASLTILRIA